MIHHNIEDININFEKDKNSARDPDETKFMKKVNRIYEQLDEIA